MSIREWLISNGYQDVARKIDKVMSVWAKQGKRTRRNWWDVLAGTKQGRRKKIEGIVFPILLVARARKGWGAVPGCLARNEGETPLPFEHQARWEDRSESHDPAVFGNGREDREHRC